MSWRTAAAVLIAIFAIVLVQSALAGPFMTFSTALNSTGDYSGGQIDANSFITGIPGAWFNMGLVAMFGLMLWAVARVVRRELTRGGGGF